MQLGPCPGAFHIEALVLGVVAGGRELERKVRMCASQPECRGPGFLHLHLPAFVLNFFFFFTSLI